MQIFFRVLLLHCIYCQLFNPSAEYLPCVMLRYTIMSFILLRLLQLDDDKKHKFNSSTDCVYYAGVMTKNIKTNSSTMFTTPRPWQKNLKFHFRTKITKPWSTRKKRSSSYCNYVHYAMVMSKKNEVSFHHYTHYAVIHPKKINFNFCSETIATTFTT